MRISAVIYECLLLWIVNVNSSFWKFLERLLTVTWILEPSNNIHWNILEYSVRFCDNDVILLK